MLIPGLYRHYKGQDYRVLALGKHVETKEELITYQACYGENKTWVQPKERFMEEVEWEGKIVPRFKLIASI